MSFFDTIQEFLGGATEDAANRVQDAQDAISDPTAAAEEHVQDLLNGQSEEEK